MLIEALRAMGYTIERNAAHKSYGRGFSCSLSTAGCIPGGVWFSEASGPLLQLRSMGWWSSSALHCLKQALAELAKSGCPGAEEDMRMVALAESGELGMLKDME